MKSTLRRKRTLTNLTNGQLSNFAVGEHDFHAEVFSLLRRFQKHHCERDRIPRREFKSLERFEILQVRNVFRGHAADDFRGDCVANPNSLSFQVFTIGIVYFTDDFYLANHNSVLINCHTGEDLSSPSGTPIYSIAAGTVTSAGYDGSYGYKTVVTLEDGTELWYCHQTSIGVSVGETLVPGQSIGTVGSTGNTTGPHLHLEVRPGAGDAVDPVSALAARGVVL